MPRIANAVRRLSAGLVIVHVNGLDRRSKGPGRECMKNREDLALGRNLQAGIIEADFLTNRPSLARSS